MSTNSLHSLTSASSSSPKLPSLSVGYGKKKGSMSKEAFASSFPIVRRDRVNLIFEDILDDVKNIPTGFSRNGLRTPPHIRIAIESAIHGYAVAIDGKKSTSTEKSKILSPAKTISTLFDENKEREKEKVNDYFAEQRTMNRVKTSIYLLTKEEKESKLVEPILVDVPLVEKAIDTNTTEEDMELPTGSPLVLELAPLNENDLAVKINAEKCMRTEVAKLELKNMFMRAARDAAVFPTEDDLPEKFNSPRHLYLRHLEKQKLLPIPYILRTEAQPTGLFSPHPFSFFIPHF